MPAQLQPAGELLAAHQLLPLIRQLHERLREAIVATCEQAAVEELAQVDREGEEDTLYAVDRVGEEELLSFFDDLDRRSPLVLVAEGLSGGGQVVLPEGADAEEALWRIIVDPIDGTRGLMYQKRSAWVLTGVAPNWGPRTGLQDIVLAVQTEIPLVKQHLCDTLWAIKNQGAHAERCNRLSGERYAIPLRPSSAATIAHGFATISRFFPGAREWLAALDDELARAALGPLPPGRAACFEDQYISSGGQLHELAVGHDRFVADLRPLMASLLARRGQGPLVCSHPYDLCTELIAREAGVIVTDPWGGPLMAPLSVEGDVAWVGYANAALRQSLEGPLQAALLRLLA
ncbi:MAG: inositol monophosphatase [Candidatus Handelsmanbacteria bacterium]|nr:inositol monophosphatase [Candidatus Handelsmanbacteria bacterium]